MRRPAAAGFHIALYLYPGTHLPESMKSAAATASESLFSVAANSRIAESYHQNPTVPAPAAACHIADKYYEIPALKEKGKKTYLLDYPAVYFSLWRLQRSAL